MAAVRHAPKAALLLVALPSCCIATATAAQHHVPDALGDSAAVPDASTGMDKLMRLAHPHTPQRPAKGIRNGKAQLRSYDVSPSGAVYAAGEPLEPRRGSRPRLEVPRVSPELLQSTRRAPRIEMFTDIDCRHENLAATYTLPKGASLVDDQCTSVQAMLAPTFPHNFTGVQTGVEFSCHMKALCEGADSSVAGAAKICAFLQGDDKDCMFAMSHCMVIGDADAARLGRGQCVTGAIEPEGLTISVRMLDYSEEMQLPECLVPAPRSPSTTVFVVLGVIGGCVVLSCLAGIVFLILTNFSNAEAQGTVPAQWPAGESEPLKENEQ